MTELREHVHVMTPYGRRRGTLVVGHYGMPEIEVEHPDGSEWPDDYYTPGSFPAAWTLSSLTCGDLYTAWRDIEAVMNRLREAQCEAEEPREPDCIDLAKAEWEAKGER